MPRRAPAPDPRRLGHDGHRRLDRGAGSARSRPVLDTPPAPAAHPRGRRAGSERDDALPAAARPVSGAGADLGSGGSTGAGSRTAPDSAIGWNGTGIRWSPWISTSGVSAANSSCGNWAITSSRGSLRPSPRCSAISALLNPDQVGRELIGDVAPRDPGHPFRELGDHELAGDPEESGIAEARRHLVLRREERAGRELIHDAVERDPQHHFRSAGRRGAAGLRAGASRRRTRRRRGSSSTPLRARAAEAARPASPERASRWARERAPLARAAPRSGSRAPRAGARSARARAWRRGLEGSPTGARRRRSARGEAGRARATGHGAAPGAGSRR